MSSMLNLEEFLGSQSELDLKLEPEAHSELDNKSYFCGYELNPKYQYNKRNLGESLEVLQRSKAMKTPRGMMFSFGFDPDLFQTERFTQRFKEAFSKAIKKRNKERKQKHLEDIKSGKKEVGAKLSKRSIPDIELIYSLECKLSKPHDAPPEKEKVKYHHIHLYVVVDTHHNEYGKIELALTLSEAIRGLGNIYEPHDKAKYGFLHLRKDSYIHESGFKEKFWHYLDDAEDFSDAFNRVCYLSKTSQKPLLDEKFKNQSFGHTRVKRKPKA